MRDILCQETDRIFPENITIKKDNFLNWSEEISVDNIWICSPENAEDVVEVINWGYCYGYKLKAKGASHNWSPLNILPQNDDSDKIIFIDTQSNLINTTLNEESSLVTVTAEMGITMDTFCDFLEGKGYGFNSMPALGDLTLVTLIAGIIM